MAAEATPANRDVPILMVHGIDDPVIKYVPRLVGSAYDGVTVREVDVKALQKALREQGAAPGDQLGRNPDVPPLAAALAIRPDVLETA